MDIEALKTSPVGTLLPIKGHDERSHSDYDTFAFIPAGLPEIDDIVFSNECWNEITAASDEITRLSEASQLIHTSREHRFMLLRREAVSSSGIEGTYATYTEVLQADLTVGVSSAAREVSDFFNASQKAIQYVNNVGVTPHLLNQVHDHLFSESKNPKFTIGKVRDEQVFIGKPGSAIEDARYIPPPGGAALEVRLRELFEWNDRNKDSLPCVLRCALFHYQFESLHPYGDGNGRIGRLIVLLQLIADGKLDEPYLILSPYFERNRFEYQDELFNVSATGNFERWVRYFINGMLVQSKEGIRIIRELKDLSIEYRKLIAGDRPRKGVILQVAEDLIHMPMLSAPQLVQEYEMSPTHSHHVIDTFCDYGIIRHVVNSGRTKIYQCDDVIRILEK